MFDAKIANLARQQHGVFTTEQAVRVGGSRTMIRRRVNQGRWQVIQPGVMAMAGTPTSVELTLMAACLAGGEGSAVSHRSAVDLWTSTELREPAEVTVRREVQRRSPVVRVHRSRDLVPDHVTERSSLPVTTPARTLVDLGQVAPWWEVERAVERFLSRKLVTVSALGAIIVVHSRQGRRGVGTLRRIMGARALGDAPAESVLEAALANLCRDAGLPTPTFQHETEIAGSVRRIDFCYPSVRLAIEVDGYEFHAAPTQFEADRIRGNELLLAGWQVLHFTWDQVIHRPDYVVATIRRALRGTGLRNGS